MRKFLIGLTIIAAALLQVVATSGVVYADQVIYAQGGATMIWVNTGAKDYTHHTQWVSRITVESGASTCPSLYEAWTAGFYASSVRCSPTAVTWYINRWVPTGNYVCGAAQASNGKITERQIACIAIRV
ncbi:MAG TPA: hypothetical protein VNG90_03030 [Candidatus Acidoferrum sp.]|nr:hypothetical protein [Candidatus Acidoferrum sp.]